MQCSRKKKWGMKGNCMGRKEGGATGLPCVRQKGRIGLHRLLVTSGKVCKKSSKPRGRLSVDAREGRLKRRAELLLQAKQTVAL